MKHLSVGFVSAFLAAILSSSCSLHDCSNEVIREEVSPDETMRFVIFSRNCGATTGFNTQGMILERHEKLPDEPGNVFVVDGEAGAQVSWKSASEAVVRFDLSTQIFRQETSVRGVSIQYEKP